jgi:bile acid:Na+ symporter, BASS family
MPLLNPLLKFFKDWSMPFAMVFGIIFHRFMNDLSMLIPYMIFFMLLLTFAKLTPSKLHFNKMHVWLIGIQLLGSVGMYLMLVSTNKLLAESALICFLAPTATSAAVVTGLLGGSVASLTTYTLLSNLMVAILGPLIFSIVGPTESLTFLASFMEILSKVAPLLLLPLITAFAFQRYAPQLNNAILKLSKWPFYIWILALAIVTGRTVCFLIDQENPNIMLELLIAGVSLGICTLQFFLGKRIGQAFGKKISGGQALGQKNTILAIWMAQTFLSPVASLGPAAYVLWQNGFNSWQLYQRRKSALTTTEED